MKKRFALMTAVALMSSSMFVQAATFTSSDSKVQLETPNDNWYVEDFEGAILFVTNGDDRVSVKVYGKDEKIPAPMKAEDAESYEEIYQTYYTAGDYTYVITGLALTKADIKAVRKVAESFQLVDHMDATDEENTSEDKTEEKTEEKKKTEDKAEEDKENGSDDKEDSQEEEIAPEAKGDDYEEIAPEARGDDYEYVAPEARGDE